jgi:hypothetical protein
VELERLEGNTYSLLDTKRLIEFRQEAEGRDRLDAQMILNHKDAVEFIVSNAAEIAFNRYTIVNLHAILANNLLADERAAGRLRHIGFGIDGSVYHPPETPPLVEECFDQLLATAATITDPFEQSIFVIVQLPYLQPFDDVNKRVSRMAATIPFIKANPSPFSFTDLPRNLDVHAILGFYELNRIEMLQEVFIWSYERIEVLDEAAVVTHAAYIVPPRPEVTRQQIGKQFSLDPRVAQILRIVPEVPRLCGFAGLELHQSVQMVGIMDRSDSMSTRADCPR